MATLNLAATDTPHHAGVTLPPMTPLIDHTHLIGNKAALDEAWEREGYWFFKGVLDKAAIGRLREAVVIDLIDQGVVDPIEDIQSVSDVQYNGASLEKFDLRVPGVAKSRPFQEFVKEPAIHEAFTRILDDEPFWLPIIVYRAYAPTQDPSSSRLLAMHQDGPHSRGIYFRVCWFPLVNMDQDLGGMILGEGLTQRYDRHPPLTNDEVTPMDMSELEGTRWRHTTCEPGDLLMMNYWLPHSGLNNISNRFRLSIDARLMGKSEDTPLVGTIMEISESSITIRADSRNHELVITPKTLIHARNTYRNKVTDYYHPGSEVIVMRDGGIATLIRTPSYDGTE